MLSPDIFPNIVLNYKEGESFDVWFGQEEWGKAQSLGLHFVRL